MSLGTSKRQLKRAKVLGLKQATFRLLRPGRVWVTEILEAQGEEEVAPI